MKVINFALKVALVVFLMGLALGLVLGFRAAEALQVPVATVVFLRV